MTPALTASRAADLTRALTEALRQVLPGMPSTADLDPAALAARLAPVLEARLAGGERFSSTGLERQADTIEARVLAALRRYPAGRSPGVAPDALRNLTGLPQEALGPAVSALVQAGEVVRDAWLVRLPQPDDLLVGAPPPQDERRSEPPQELERRAIGDRRAVGERRLYDRRTLDHP